MSSTSGIASPIFTAAREVDLKARAARGTAVTKRLEASISGDGCVRFKLIDKYNGRYIYLWSWYTQRKGTTSRALQSDILASDSRNKLGYVAQASRRNIAPKVDLYFAVRQWLLGEWCKN